MVKEILGPRFNQEPLNTHAEAFAPSNIALCKYWGKRNQELNLPITSSLSVSLGNKGAEVKLDVSSKTSDEIILNGEDLDLFTPFSKRLIEFINLFRSGKLRLNININSNIPIAAGMASSACGFASIVLALNNLYGWNLKNHELSLLSRLGSGSACRSVWSGFVEWHVGMREDGMDSHGEVLHNIWPGLCIGLLILSKQDKGIPSRAAMQRTITTSSLYSAWPAKVAQDLTLIKRAIAVQDFDLLGQTAESNAMAMHATMLSAWPPVMYYLPETIAAIRKLWNLRLTGLPIYFTQDAGPNLKLLFMDKDVEVIRQEFPSIDVLFPFAA